MAKRTALWLKLLTLLTVGAVTAAWIHGGGAGGGITPPPPSNCILADVGSCILVDVGSKLLVQ